MKADNPIGILHSALAHATYEGMSIIEYEDRDWEHYRKTKEDKRIKKQRTHSSYDLTVYAMFPQTWGSTALGFGGVGGQAITTSYVVIVESDQTGEFCVYFGGRFAYKINRPTHTFFEDVSRQRMADVKDFRKYEDDSR